MGSVNNVNTKRRSLRSGTPRTSLVYYSDTGRCQFNFYYGSETMKQLSPSDLSDCDSVQMYCDRQKMVRK